MSKRKDYRRKAEMALMRANPTPQSVASAKVWAFLYDTAQNAHTAKLDRRPAGELPTKKSYVRAFTDEQMVSALQRYRKQPALREATEAEHELLADMTWREQLAYCETNNIRVDENVRMLAAREAEQAEVPGSKTREETHPLLWAVVRKNHEVGISVAEIALMTGLPEKDVLEILEQKPLASEEAPAVQRTDEIIDAVNRLRQRTPAREFCSVEGYINVYAGFWADLVAVLDALEKEDKQ